MRVRIAIGALVILSGSLLLTGCSSFGHVKMNQKSNDKSSKISSSTDSSRKASEAAESSKEAVQAQGKKYTYGLPYGPSWLYLYSHGENTGVHFLPNKYAVAKVGENDKIFFSGTLPLVGKVKTSEEDIKSTDATMDDKDKFQRQLDLLFEINDNTLKVEFDRLNNIDNHAVAKQAFTDNIKYLSAVSTNDSKKLPNQSEDLKDSLSGDSWQDDAKDKYQVIEQYYTKDETQVTDGNDDDHTYVTTDSDSETPTTQLEIHIYAKVKVTDIDKDKPRTSSDEKIGNSHLRLIPYALTYDLVSGNKWQLRDDTAGVDSDYELDTSGTSWISQKY